MRKGQQIHEITRKALVAAAKAAKGNRSVMARILGIPRTTLYVYLERWDVKRIADAARIDALKQAFSTQYG